MQKDISEKLLEEYNDVFSDIVNGLLFDGREIIKPDSLEDFLPKSQYKIETGKLHEEERDIGKKWLEQTVVLSKIGLENQSSYCKEAPIRVIGYDGANYREQLLDKNTKKYYPVITVVLNFSMTRWKNTNLLDCLEVPDILAPFVSDYHINVFDIAFLTDEQIEYFKSDFKMVAEYFVSRRLKREFKLPEKLPDHIDEIMKLLQAVTGDVRFTDDWKIAKADYMEGSVNMGEAWLDKIEARGEAKGEARGILIGEAKGEKKGMIRAFNADGHTLEEIAELVKEPISFVEEVLNSKPASTIE